MSDEEWDSRFKQQLMDLAPDGTEEAKYTGRSASFYGKDFRLSLCYYGWILFASRPDQYIIARGTWNPDVKLTKSEVDRIVTPERRARFTRSITSDWF